MTLSILGRFRDVECRLVRMPRYTSNPRRQRPFSGLTWASPSQPRLALSIELLDLYRALFERSCDAVNALASALHTHYARRGFHYRNSAVRNACSLWGIDHT